MVNEAYNVSLELALGYTKRGVVLATEKDNKEWIPKFQEMQGRTHANLSQLDSALLFFDKAMAGFIAINNKKGQATTYFKMAWAHRHTGEHEKAMNEDLIALRLMEELDDKRGIASALGRVSEDLLKQGQADEALKYSDRAIKICEENNLQEQLSSELLNASYASVVAGEHEMGLKYADRAITIIKARGSDLTDMADASNSRGNALKRLGRYDEAIADYKVCLENSEKVNYAGGISSAIANLGEVNLLKGDFKEALPYQLKTIRLQLDNGDFSNLAENYLHLSTIYENLGEYKPALLYQKKALHLRDSINSVASDMALSELRTKYETEKQDATISIQEARLGQQRKMQWLYIGIAVLLGLFAFSFYRNALTRKKTNQQLSVKNAENELLLKEIHHRVKNNLEVVSSLLALQSAQIDDPGIKGAMQEGQNRVQSIGIVHQKLYQGTNLAAVEMKDYFINLSDSILDSFGAEGRITIECAMNNLELDIDTAVPLGLITNEILTNALKYAFPDGRKGRIEIGIVQKDPQTMQLKIADNGVGKSGVIHGTGFGSQLITLLTQQLNGSMREEVREGTAVYIDFAMKKIA